ncbi:MAG: hypothetical protein HFG62_01990 [Lachnospiraceae bacterium]|nr:hypothetical protein [Lachnospiraceae bacterium]
MNVKKRLKPLRREASNWKPPANKFSKNISKLKNTVSVVLFIHYSFSITPFITIKLRIIVIGVTSILEIINENRKIKSIVTSSQIML